NAASIEKSLDLFVDAADRLNISSLVHRTGHGKVSPQRQVRKRGEQRVNFRGAGAVAVDAGIRLFEADAGGQRKRLVFRKDATQISCDDVHALVVEPPAQVGLALNIDQARLASRRPCRTS